MRVDEADVGRNPEEATRLRGDLETQAVESIILLNLHPPGDGASDEGGRNGVGIAKYSECDRD